MLCVMALFGFWSDDKAPKTDPEPASAQSPEMITREDAEKAIRAAAEKAAAEAAKVAAEQIAKEAADKALQEAQAEIAKNAATVEAAKLEAEAKAAEEKAKEAAKAEEKEAKAERVEELKRIDTRVFKLNHASATEIAEKFNEMWNGEFGQNWKVTKMAVAFQESNAVMITAPKAILGACEKMICELDVEARQVYIEARFVELSNNASHKLGID